MSRLSFRQLLFAAFILIAAVLTTTSVQALLTLERLARLGRENAAQAVLLTEQAQQLAERSQAMERSARQFMVLGDAPLRTRYVDAWQDASSTLAAMRTTLPALPVELVNEWNASSNAIWSALKLSTRPSHSGSAALQTAFARLPALNDSLARAGKQEIARRSAALLSELERQRRLLASLLAGAVLVAALLALGFGLWLSRPLRRIELAIANLGQNHFQQSVSVGGPADTRRLGQQLDWLRQRLAALNDDQDRFVRHISHELKTPLAALREGVALLEDEVTGPLTDGQREIAAILRANSLSLQTQIEDLLRYNTAAFDAQHLQRSHVDLAALLHTVIDAQRLQWQARRLQVTLDGSAPPLLLDADKMAVALANILSNAVRFSPDGGKIMFQLGSTPSGVSIACIDQGPGVARVDQERIFEPFYQGERQRAGARNGNGIGLSIVREYIAAHNGTVRLVARQAGAHFQIELPHDT